MKKEIQNKFPGFSKIGEAGTFWMYPNIMDQYWHTLSGSEQKVLDYLLRRTFGFQKTQDKVSHGQFAKGIKGYDKGTGMIEKTVSEALKKLEQKGFVKIQRFIKDTGEKEINEYRLVMSKRRKGDNKNTPRGNDKNSLPRDDGNTGTINSSSINRKSINRTIGEIHLYYQEKICAGARLTKEGKKRIAERLKEYALHEIEKAITSFSMNNWWMENHAGEGIEWFFKSEGQIDKWINLTPSPENREEKLRRGSLG